MIKDLSRIVIAFILLSYFIFSRIRKLTLTKSVVTFDLIFITILVFIFLILLINTCFTLFPNKKGTPYSNVILNFYKNFLNNYYYVPLIECDAYIIKFFKDKYKFNRTKYVNKFLYFLYTEILKLQIYILLLILQ